MKTPQVYQSDDKPPFFLLISVPRPLLVHAGDTVPTWKSLSFSPAGLYALRSWLGTHKDVADLFDNNVARFRACDLIWFAAGASKDDNHTNHMPTHFHPSLKEFFTETYGYAGAKEERKSILQELQSLMFDIATMLDRLSGSTTMIMRSAGTVIPGTPAQPEYLKAQVYLPPAFVRDNPDLNRVLVDIVQQYIESVGVRTVTCWAVCAGNSLGYTLTQPSAGNVFRNAKCTTIPLPASRTSHYTFLGQDQRIMESVTSSSPPAAPINHAQAAVTNISSQESYDYDDYDDCAYAVMDLTESVHNLEVANQILTNDKKKLQIALVRAQERIEQLEEQLAESLKGNVRSPTRGSRSTTPFVTTRTPSKAPQTPSRVTGSAPGRALSATPTPRSCPDGPSALGMRKAPSTPVALTSAPAEDNLDGSLSLDVESELIAATLKVYNLQHLEAKIESIFAVWSPSERFDALVQLGLPPKAAKTLITLVNVQDTDDKLTVHFE